MKHREEESGVEVEDLQVFTTIKDWTCEVLTMLTMLAVVMMMMIAIVIVLVDIEGWNLGCGVLESGIWMGVVI